MGHLADRGPLSGRRGRAPPHLVGPAHGPELGAHRELGQDRLDLGPHGRLADLGGLRDPSRTGWPACRLPEDLRLAGGEELSSQASTARRSSWPRCHCSTRRSRCSRDITRSPAASRSTVPEDVGERARPTERRAGAVPHSLAPARADRGRRRRDHLDLVQGEPAPPAGCRRRDQGRCRRGRCPARSSVMSAITRRRSLPVSGRTTCHAAWPAAQSAETRWTPRAGHGRPQRPLAWATACSSALLPTDLCRAPQVSHGRERPRPGVRHRPRIPTSWGNHPQRGDPQGRRPFAWYRHAHHARVPR